jgi:hypothetical protein
VQPCTSFTSSGSEGSADKRRRFQQMRKQHYNMRDALLKVCHVTHPVKQRAVCSAAAEWQLLEACVTGCRQPIAVAAVAARSETAEWQLLGACYWLSAAHGICSCGSAYRNRKESPSAKPRQVHSAPGDALCVAHHAAMLCVDWCDCVPALCVAIAQAKQLLSEDEEDAGRRQPGHEDEHEEDEEDDTAGCQVGNGVAADPSSSRSRQQQHNASHEQHSSQHRQQQDGTASSSQQQKATDAVNS